MLLTGGRRASFHDLPQEEQDIPNTLLEHDRAKADNKEILSDQGRTRR